MVIAGYLWQCDCEGELLKSKVYTLPAPELEAGQAVVLQRYITLTVDSQRLEGRASNQRQMGAFQAYVA